MVLVRRPGLHSNLSDAWEGPFQIGMRVSSVTYSVQVSGRATTKVLHANLLKRWQNPADRIHRIVIVQDEDNQADPPECLKLVQDSFVPSEDQQKLLDQSLSRCVDGQAWTYIWTLFS